MTDARAKHLETKKKLIKKFGEEIDAYAALIVKQSHFERHGDQFAPRHIKAVEQEASAKRKLIMDAIEMLL